MCKTLYLFNPENDMALATASPYYMAPAVTQRMAADLSALPLWYADEGACVWVDERMMQLAVQQPLKPRVTLVSECSADVDRVCPWGWNPALLRRLHEVGVACRAYPSDRQMERIRQLSSRQTAVELLASLAPVLGKTPPLGESPLGESLLGESSLLCSLEAVERYVVSHPKAVLKSPWSGSGRGIQYTSGVFSLPLKGWVERVLRVQRAVVGEPFYDKLADFAMEFYAEPDGKVRFAGYSLFETDVRGVYKENVLAEEGEIERRLAGYVSPSLLHSLRARLATLIEKALKGDYQGYLGVDMMICRVEGGYAVHPCVEVNLRMNMGMVSRLVYDRHVWGGATGRYVIEYYGKVGEAERADRALQQQYPLVLHGGRVQSGYLSLTPVAADTAYQAYILVFA